MYQPHLFSERDAEERRGEDALLVSAGAVAQRTSEQRQSEQASEKRLFKLYAQPRLDHPHALGKPNLSQVEALLLVALERNGFEVETEKGENAWSGDATCRYGVQTGAVVCLVHERLDLLWALWAAVSDQQDPVTLTEEHLKGCVRRKNIRALQAELRAQKGQKEGLADFDPFHMP